MQVEMQTILEYPSPSVAELNFNSFKIILRYSYLGYKHNTFISSHFLSPYIHQLTWSKYKFGFIFSHHLSFYNHLKKKLKKFSSERNVARRDIWWRARYHWLTVQWVSFELVLEIATCRILNNSFNPTDPLISNAAQTRPSVKIWYFK